jgi:hypothetical protein
MTELTVNRTLVKSPPELWAECSDAASLARHLGAFGEIRITRLEPETTVAWEGERVSGTVRLEPSGWGTRVVLIAQLAPAEEEAEAPAESPAPFEEPEPVAEVAPVVEPPAMPRRRRARLARVLESLGWRAAPVPTPAPVEEPPPPLEEPPPPVEEPVAPAIEPAPDAEALLAAALDSLGQAHHRPFSRA